MNAVDQVLAGNEPAMPAAATATGTVTAMPVTSSGVKVEDDRNGWHKDNTNGTGGGAGAGTSAGSGADTGNNKG